MKTNPEDIKTLMEARNALLMVDENPPVGDQTADSLRIMLETKAHHDVVEVAQRMAESKIPNGRGFCHAYSNLVSVFSEAAGGANFFSQEKAAQLRPSAILILTLFINALTDGRGLLSSPASFHIDLLGLLYRYFKPAGYSQTTIPAILEDFGVPPFLQNRNATDLSGEDCLPIDGLLGSYSPSDERVTLYMQGIRLCSKTLRCSEGFLRSVVLVHEVSHWILHRLPHSTIPPFSNAAYNATDTETHEAIAQLLTAWIAFGGAPKEFKNAFEALLPRQPAKYRLFDQFKDIDHNIVVCRIGEIRKCQEPLTFARLDDLLRK